MTTLPLALSPDALLGLLADAYAENLRTHPASPDLLHGRAWEHEADLGTVRLRLRVEFTSTGMTLEQAEARIVAADRHEPPAERQAACALLQAAGLPVPDTSGEASR